jgi:2-polyprenyl-3-methyl-5-hydroxy-6-metoxy-1,4-benzoquinol methylase
LRNLSQCLVCGSSDAPALVYEATYDGTVDGAAQYFLKYRRKVAHGRIVKCRTCGFTFTNPQFTPGEYELIYAAAARDMPEADPLAVAERARFAHLARLVGKYSRSPNKLLDLGCGDGTFLKLVSANEKVGYEAGGMTAESSPGLELISGDFLADTGKPPLVEHSFDVVTAWDVFEHLPDLDRYTASSMRLLAPGGFLFVTIPDAGSLVARLSGEKWNMYLLEHLWYFSAETFDRFMIRQGFRHITHGQSLYSVSISHFAQRFSQTYGIDITGLTSRFSKMTVSLPIGLIYAVYQQSSSA